MKQRPFEAPRFPLGRLLKAVESVTSTLLEDLRLIGVVLSDNTRLSRIVRDVANRLPLGAIRVEGHGPEAEALLEDLHENRLSILRAAFESYRYAPLSEKDLRLIARRIAGLLPQIEAAVSPEVLSSWDTSQRTWTLLFVDSVSRCTRFSKYLVTFSVRAGEATGYAWQERLSRAGCLRRLRFCGLSRKLEDLQPTHLAGMMYVARIRSPDGKRIEVSDEFVDSSHEKWNKQLHNYRTTFACDGPLSAERVLCGTCHIGRSECPRAHLAQTCTTSVDCPGCGLRRPAFAAADGLCVYCVFKGLVLEKEETTTAREVPEEVKEIAAPVLTRTAQGYLAPPPKTRNL